jgi:hypothetical protein
VPEEGEGRDIGVRVDSEPRHARLVAEDRAAAARRARIDCEHRHELALRGEHGAQRVDRGRFAHTRHAGNPDPQRLPRLGQNLLQQLTRRIAPILPARFHQRDGARERGALAGDQACAQIGDVDVGGRGFIGFLGSAGLGIGAGHGTDKSS